MKQVVKEVRRGVRGGLGLALALGLCGLLAILALFSPISTSSSAASLRLQQQRGDGLGGYGEMREFEEHGKVSSLFVQMGGYRGGPGTFAVVGLSSKSLHKEGNPSFECRWRWRRQEVMGQAQILLPDWWMGRIYSVVVVNCTFPAAVGSDGAGGQLIITARYGDSDPFSPPETFVAMEEAAGVYDPSIFSGGRTYAYDYLHCGPPLFGDVSPQRIREWLAYHAWLMGPRSHFVFYDAGGIHSRVRRVLRPWEKLGMVSVHNVRQQARYDGHYHNQFLILNDCLHRYRFLSSWMFFFDTDEFLYVPPTTSLQQVMAEASSFTQLLFSPDLMSPHICTHLRPPRNEEWAMEKLVYKQVRQGPVDLKYAVQARHVFATGVHRTEHLEGESMTADPSKLRFYHYHGTTSFRSELCQEVAVPHNASVYSSSMSLFFVEDESMADVAHSVQAFEKKTIGNRPFVA